VGYRAGLDVCEKPRPHQDSIPGPSSPWSVAIPTELPGPLSSFSAALTLPLSTLSPMDFLAEGTS
jgi:hypothetical protein